MNQDYIYLGDKLTDEKYKDKHCTAVRRADGKCIRGKNSNMLVEFNGIKVVILARRLRKKNKENEQIRNLRKTAGDKSGSRN